MTIIFAIATVICGFGWLVTRIGAAALVKYMYDKKYTPPSAEEMKAYCRDVVLGALGHR